MPPFKKRRSFNNYGNNYSADGEGGSAGSTPYGRGGYSKFGGGRGGFRNNQRSTEDDAATTGPAITIPLDKRKRVTVRSYKGVKLIDLREFYTTQGNNGETLELPGKKGISLTQDAWEVLLGQVPAIQDALKSLDTLEVNDVKTSMSSVSKPTEVSKKHSKNTIKSKETVSSSDEEEEQEEKVEDEDDDDDDDIANDLEMEIAKHEAMAEVKSAGKDSDEDSSSEEE